MYIYVWLYLKMKISEYEGIINRETNIWYQRIQHYIISWGYWFQYTSAGESATTRSTLNLCHGQTHSYNWAIHMRYKKWCRCICNYLSYIRYTIFTVIALVEQLIWWLNALSLSNWVSNTMILSTILIGKHNNDINQNRITFG